VPDKKSDDQYSEEEAQRRTEATLRAAFNAPHKPQSEMKLGKSSTKSMTPKVAPAQSKKRRKILHSQHG
jgi:hypothetical protein